MMLDLVLAVLPLLCGALVVAGIVLDRRLERTGPIGDASADARVAPASVAEAPIP